MLTVKMICLKVWVANVGHWEFYYGLIDESARTDYTFKPKKNERKKLMIDIICSRYCMIVTFSEACNDIGISYFEFVHKW